MTLIYPRASMRAHPPTLAPAYRSTVKRSPTKPLIIVPQTLSELTGPVYGHDIVGPNDHDLTTQHKGEPLGERIVVHGRVLDEDGRGVPNALIEVWQANACRPLHPPQRAASRAARSELHRRGSHECPDPDGSYQPHHHQAWRLSMGQSSQRLAVRRTSISRCSARRSCRVSSPGCISRAIR